MLPNYLIAESLIIDRIMAEVPGLNFVMGAAGLQQVQNLAQHTPAAFVIYMGDQVNQHDGSGPQKGFAGQGAKQVVDQVWTVVIAVRNVSDQIGGAAQRSEAGELLSKVLQALSGWTPAPEFRPLRRVNGGPAYYEAGYGYFQLNFRTRIIFP